MAENLPPPLPPPDAVKTPKPNKAADSMITLGILTASCQDADDPTKKNRCEQIIKPLETNRQDAVDTLTNMIVELGEDNLEGAVDRFNFILYEATAKAKEVMIQQGTLNADGTPKQ